MSAVVEQSVRYAAPSGLSATPRGPRLHLSADVARRGPAVQFDGTLSRAPLAARLLASVGDVVGSRFHVPPAMLGKILRLADPVLTTGDGWLRVEGFSACAGVYARADFGPDSHDGGVKAPGTTNVDFGPDVRAALASVRTGDRLALRVGADAVEVRTGDARAVERKVPLPQRWLRSFVAVQDVQAALPLRHELGPVEALRFLRSLPRAATKRSSWIVGAERGLRSAARPAADGVRVVATERLRVLEALVHDARRVLVHGGPDAPGAGFVLDFGDRRFTLVLSAEAWRGFSGEGRALDALASPADDALVSLLHGALRWRASLAPADLARELGEPEDAVRRALVELGVRGVVGFDLATGASFHRELPYDLASLPELQPRFAAAQALAAADGAVRLVAEAGGTRTYETAGSGVTHTVELRADGTFRCTCTWHAKHDGERGPCKHVLAARMTSQGGLR